MKEAVREHGLDGLNDHQILEMLLFYGVPNGDTNPTAHRLIEKFGSLRAVLEADYNDLVQIVGIGENAASLIKFSQLLARRYLCAACFKDSETLRFIGTDNLCRYYEGVFLGVRDEQIRAMALDYELGFIKEELLINGTIGKVELSPRQIADFAVRNRCSRVVLAHNHPNGASMPSNSDISVTSMLARVLSGLDIELTDHIIVGMHGGISLRSTELAKTIWPEDIVKKVEEAEAAGISLCSPEEKDVPEEISPSEAEMYLDYAAADEKLLGKTAEEIRDELALNAQEFDLAGGLED